MKSRKTAKQKRERFENFLKWTTLTIIGLMLFMGGSRAAFHHRGYDAVGGEIFLLFIPLIYKAVEDMVNDLKEEIKRDYEAENRRASKPH